MKQILNNAPSLNIVTQRSPLTVKLSVRVAAGTLTQAQDEMQSLWIPDRTLNVLILEPIFSAYNSDTESSVDVNPSITWWRRVYSGNTYSDTRITSTTPSDNYYKETNEDHEDTGRLCIRKNVDYRNPEFIVCKAEYTDNVRNDSYTEEFLVTLSSENRPDEFYSVKIQDTATVVFSPLIDSTSLHTISALVSKGEKQYPWSDIVGSVIGAVDLGSLTWTYSSSVFSANLPSAAKTTGSALAGGYTQNQSLSANKTLSTSTNGKIRIKDSSYNTAAAFKKAMTGRVLLYELATQTKTMDFLDAVARMTTFYWYCNDELINDDMPGYVSGQGTNSLVLDMDYFDNDTLSVKLGIPEFTETEGIKSATLPTSPNAPQRDSVLLAWDWGHLDALPIARGGSKVRERTQTKIFDAVVRREGVNVDDAKVDEYIRLNWRIHSTDANYSNTSDKGWGRSIEIDAADLKKTGVVSSEVYVDIYTLSPLGLLTMPDGSYVVDDNDPNTFIVGRG